MAERIDPGVDIGHVHLKVADIERAVGFYRDVLGFDLVQRYGSEAAFLSAGGYHHHVGLNVWKGQGVGPPPPHTVGLEHWTVMLPSADDVTEVSSRVERAGYATEAMADGFRVRDPWQLAVAFVSA